MNKLAMQVLVLLFGFLVFNVNAREKPQLPYYAWGACERACKQKGGEHFLKKVLTVYKRPNVKGGIAFAFKPNEEIEVVDYAKVITRPTILEMKIKYVSDECAFKKGEVVYGLAYLAEGRSEYWHNGKIVECEDPSSDAAKVISEGEEFYWTKVKNKKGKVGWIQYDESTYDLFYS